MENPCTLPAQLVIEGDLGSQLLNAAVRHDERLLKARPRPRRHTRRSKAPSHRLEDTVALGASALLKHCYKLIHRTPLEVVHGHDGSTIVRVCHALEYVIDEAKCLTHARAAHDRAHLLIDQEGILQPTDTILAYENIDLLLPLCRPFWLNFVAYLPDGICGLSTETDLFQLPLWEHMPNAAQIVDAICQAVHQKLRVDPVFQRLRVALSYRLMEIIGTSTVHLAMRARINVKGCGLDARDVCQVWRHQDLYLRMDRENPHMLPVLSAWLYYRELPDNHGLNDAIPAMRQDLLAHGLSPRAWRYLVEHGPRSLVYRTHRVLKWRNLVEMLKLLHKARWPAPPPRGFLGFLNDTAGEPESYNCAGAGVPGWFWDWTCHEARVNAHDPQRYQDLRNKVVRWAWLVREYQPRPDSNQRRRRLQWLQDWAAHQEAITSLSDQDAWSIWLRDISWDDIKRLRVVPLLSPRSLREEGIAMHNCADRYLDECSKGSYLLLSLRDPNSDKRMALMGLRRNRNTDAWELKELSGSCNRKVQGWIKPIAEMVVAMVRQADDAHRAAKALLRTIAQRSNTA